MYKGRLLGFTNHCDVIQMCICKFFLLGWTTRKLTFPVLVALCSSKGCPMGTPCDTDCLNTFIMPGLHFIPTNLCPDCYVLCNHHSIMHAQCNLAWCDWRLVHIGLNNWYIRNVVSVAECSPFKDKHSCHEIFLHLSMNATKKNYHIESST